MQKRTLVGAVEGGGTKFVCAIGEGPALIRERFVVPTTDPATTLDACVAFFRTAARRHGALTALGIGCFGPLQLRRDASDFGSVLATPKPGWSNVQVRAPFRDALHVPVALDTDVAAAARGELRADAGCRLASLAYVTVGTGIGGAVAPHTDARTGHAEMGHLPVRRDARDAAFAGVCPFHGDCLEGLASGPAVRARWGCELAALPGDHVGRDIIAGYVAQLVVAIALLHAPDAVVIGGGVMSDGSLLPRVRSAVRAQLGGYLSHLADAAGVDAFVRSPALGDDSALAGAMWMALDVHEAGRQP